MKGSLFGSWDFLRYLRKVHIQYSTRRPETSQNAKNLILRLTSQRVQQQHPQLQVTWEMLDYDAPASVEATLVNGVRHRQLLEGYSSAQRREIVDKWRFSANLEPWEEVLAPKLKEAPAAAQDKQQHQQKHPTQQ